MRPRDRMRPHHSRKVAVHEAARREMTATMIEAGVSQREAAKVLGIGQTQIRRDLGPGGSETKQKGSTKAERSEYFAEMMQAIAKRAKLDDDDVAEIRAKVRAAHEAESEPS